MGRTLRPQPHFGSSPHDAGLGPPAQVAIAAAIAALAGLTIATTQNGLLSLGLFAAAGFVVFGLARPALFLSVFLVIRPLIDDYSQVTVSGLNVAGVLGMILFGVLVMVVITRPRIVRPGSSWAFILVLLLSCVVAVEATFNFGSGLSSDLIAELVRLCALLGVYLLAANLFNTESGVERVFAIVGLSGVLPAVQGIVELITGNAPQPVGYDLYRISGTFVGPVPFASFLAITTLLLISLPRHVMSNWVRLPAIVVMLTALVGTYTREGWVLFVLGLVMIEWRRRKSMVLATAAIIIAVVALVPPVHDRVLPAKEDAAAGPNSGGFSSYEWRISNWSGLLDRYAEKPILGFGLTSVGYVNPRVPVASQGVPGGGYDAHNTGVRTLVEGGILLLLAYVALFSSVIIVLARAARARWRLAHYARVALMLWIGLTIVSLTTNDPFEATAMMYGVLAVTGAVCGAWVTMRRQGGEHVLAE